MLLAGATSRSGDRRADLATDRLPNDSLSIEIALKDDHGRPASVTTRKPHRHAYHELIWNRRGVGQHLIDGRAQTIGRNTVTVVGRGQVHEFLGGTGMSGAIAPERRDHPEHCPARDALVLAWIFIFHGAGKLFGFDHQGGIAGTTAFFQLEGLPAPHLMAYLVGLTELGGRLLLLIGFAAPLAALALAVDMLVAIVTTTFATGMLPKALPGGIVADGFEIKLALLALALALAIAALGAGRLSLDSALGLSAPRGRAE